jgi:hypothetical protein
MEGNQTKAGNREDWRFLSVKNNAISIEGVKKRHFLQLSNSYQQFEEHFPSLREREKERSNLISQIIFFYSIRIHSTTESNINNREGIRSNLQHNVHTLL